MKNYKWNRDGDSKGEGALRVCLFTSRNKDNKDVADFKKRRRSFLVYDSITNLEQRFEEFVQEGVPGEMSRLYLSVNGRDPEKVKKYLAVELITQDDLRVGHINSIAAGIAARSVCRAEDKWLLDFDDTDPEALKRFVAVVGTYMVENETFRMRKEMKGATGEEIKAAVAKEAASPDYVNVYPTPHGYAVICKHGFDPRPLKRDWPQVTVMKDDLLCKEWKTKK